MRCWNKKVSNTTAKADALRAVIEKTKH